MLRQNNTKKIAVRVSNTRKNLGFHIQKSGT